MCPWPRAKTIEDRALLLEAGIYTADGCDTEPASPPTLSLATPTTPINAATVRSMLHRPIHDSVSSHAAQIRSDQRAIFVSAWPGEQHWVEDSPRSAEIPTVLSLDELVPAAMGQRWFYIDDGAFVKTTDDWLPKVSQDVDIFRLHSATTAIWPEVQFITVDDARIQRLIIYIDGSGRITDGQSPSWAMAVFADMGEPMPNDITTVY